MPETPTPTNPTPEKPDTPPPPGGGGTQTLRDLLAPVVAVVVLVAFFIVLGKMWGRTASSDENEWLRLVYLFGSLEAVAFAAAGFLFGSEVHRKRAETAEVQAGNAAADAAEAEGKAADAQAKGRALAEAVRSLGGRGAVSFETRGVKGPPPGDQPEIRTLHHLADRLFPES